MGFESLLRVCKVFQGDFRLKIEKIAEKDRQLILGLTHSIKKVKRKNLIVGESAVNFYKIKEEGITEERAEAILLKIEGGNEADWRF